MLYHLPRFDRNEPTLTSSVTPTSQDTHQSPPDEARDLLIEAGRVLASSLDFEATVQAAVRLFIPILADWGVIYLRDADESVRVATVAHTDPDQSRAAQQMLTRYRSEAALPRAPLRVMRTGQSEIVSEIESVITEMAQDAEHLEALRQARMKAAMTVPLTTRGRTMGAISFVSAESERMYGPPDLALAEELGRRVATAIDNARLYSEAQAAIRARDDVLGIVAHDLRNPVGTIRMAAQFLSEVEMPHEQRQKHYGIIVRAADRMNSLIQDLLDVSSIEAGRLSIVPDTLDVRALLDEVRDMFHAQVEARLQSLHFQCPTTLPTVHADRDRVLQVFSNLIGNAVKFTPEGGRITISAERATDAVRFTVADTGRGIAAEELPHIFDRFWQSKHTRRGGAGLGLAITKGIVEAHRGQITVSSTPGIGTEFTFTLPSRYAESLG
jgi:signal transduction histidine kinase